MGVSWHRRTDTGDNVWLVVMTAVVLILLPVLHGSVASAHTTLRRATPGPAQVVDAGVDALTLEFLGPVSDGGVVIVSDGNGAPVAGLDGPVLAAPDRLVVRFAPLAPGTYRVDARVVAVDGDAWSDAYTFTVRASDGRAFPSGAAAIGLTVVGGALLAGAGFWLLRAARSRGRRRR